MKKTYLLALPLIIGLLTSCQNGKQSSNKSPEKSGPKDTTAMVNDPHSYAQPEKAVVSHLNWDARVLFDSATIVATATWDIKAPEKTDQIVFDTYDLSIQEVKVDGQRADFTLGAFQEDQGRPLTVSLPANAQKVRIDYRTGDSARALQWLSPEQTASGSARFLFTQSQAILARSWVPCQDSPGNRFTYEADVQVPEGMLALMSAQNPQEKNKTGQYHFEMPQPIPSYLMALAVGDIRFKAISERTGVYAEQPLLEKAAYEFADLEKMVQAAEELYGPYAWGRYDIIVLPPSFPFGGMENPRLTFATPTILAGDRSLVSLVAHELAHSWSGNLVTNATWNDFWLNEGFTVYFEHRIMEEVYGRDYSEMLASLTRSELKEDAAAMLEERPEDTKLKLDLAGRNPDEGVTSIPYNKGYFFLRLIEEEVGRSRFDTFLRNYFDKHQFEVMTTEAFLSYLQENLLSAEQYERLQIDTWIYKKGLPENLPKVPSQRFAKVAQALEEFMKAGTLPAQKQTAAWTTHEWLHFLHKLPDSVTVNELQRLDEAYHFSQSGNSEILAAWFQPTIRAGYEPIYSRVDSFLVQVGRRKFLTPTYAALQESGRADLAQAIYQKARPGYHAVSRETLDELLDP